MFIGERIYQARSRRGYSQSQLASMVGVSRGACSQWERGVSFPSVEKLSLLSIMLDVAFEWLATGRGVMWDDQQIQEPERKYDSQPGLTDEQRELLASYSRLSLPKRKALIKLLQVI